MRRLATAALSTVLSAGSALAGGYAQPVFASAPAAPVAPPVAERTTLGFAYADAFVVPDTDSNFYSFGGSYALTATDRIILQFDADGFVSDFDGDTDVDYQVAAGAYYAITPDTRLGFRLNYADGEGFDGIASGSLVGLYLTESFRFEAALTAPFDSDDGNTFMNLNATAFDVGIEGLDIFGEYVRSFDDVADFYGYEVSARYDPAGGAFGLAPLGTEVGLFGSGIDGFGDDEIAVYAGATYDLSPTAQLHARVLREVQTDFGDEDTAINLGLRIGLGAGPNDAKDGLVGRGGFFSDIVN